MLSQIKTFLPASTIERLSSLKWRLVHLRNQHRSPGAIFSDVYRNRRWGGNEEDYYSGSGSDEALALPYADAVLRFLRDNQIRSIADLGCGDFRVGSLLAIEGINYVGIDVVPELIARNRTRYASTNVSFACLDIVANDLPAADVCLIRQVFQHLSNDQIYAILSKLEQYKWALVTEHYPAPEMIDITPNRDKPAGPDTRINDRSAVFLDLPPFQVAPGRMLLDVELPQWLVQPGERLKTFAFERLRPSPREILRPEALARPPYRSSEFPS